MVFEGFFSKECFSQQARTKDTPEEEKKQTWILLMPYCNCKDGIKKEWKKMITIANYNKANCLKSQNKCTTTQSKQHSAGYVRYDDTVYV